VSGVPDFNVKFSFFSFCCFFHTKRHLNWTRITITTLLTLGVLYHALIFHSVVRAFALCATSPPQNDAHHSDNEKDTQYDEQNPNLACGLFSWWVCRRVQICDVVHGAESVGWCVEQLLRCLVCIRTSELKCDVCLSI